jgi:hypothetical protein
MIWYQLGEWLVELVDRVAAPQKIYGAKMLIQNPPYQFFLGAVDPKDLRSQTVALLRLRPSSVRRSFEPRLKETLETHMHGRVLANAFTLTLLPGYPPPAPTPASHH